MLSENSWILNDRQLCDCQMILDHSFYPLNRFMTKNDYDQVLKKMRLESGELFPIPIVLDVDEKFSQKLLLNEKITLRDKEGYVIAKMTVESIWEPDLENEAELVYGTRDSFHPGVNFLSQSKNKVYLGGKLKKLACQIIMIIHATE